MAHDVFPLSAVDPFEGLVDVQNSAIQVAYHDRVARGFDGRRQRNSLEFLGTLLFGHVPVDGDITDDLPGCVEDRRNRLFDVVERPVLFPVQERTAPNLAAGDCLPQRAIERLGLLATFQDARILADGLFARVRGYRLMRSNAGLT